MDRKERHNIPAERIISQEVTMSKDDSERNVAYIAQDSFRPRMKTPQGKM